MTELQEIKKAIQENNAKLELILSKIAPQSDLLTLKQVCKMLGRSTDYVGKLKHRINLIDPKAKGHKKYIRSEVEKLLSY